MYHRGDGAACRCVCAGPGSILGISQTIKQKVMRMYKNDIIKASAISTGADRGVLLCSITDSGFTSIAGVISAVKDRLPNEDHKKMVLKS